MKSMGNITSLSGVEFMQLLAAPNIRVNIDNKEGSVKLYSLEGSLETTLSNAMKSRVEKEVTDIDIAIKISNLLHELGIPSHIKGYSLLRSSILMVINDFGLINNITKSLYPTLAKKYNTTASGVEHGISNAITHSWDRGNPEKLEKLFGYTVNSTMGKPTNSEFIALIADYLRLTILNQF